MSHWQTDLPSSEWRTRFDIEQVLRMVKMQQKRSNDDYESAPISI